MAFSNGIRVLRTYSIDRKYLQKKDVTAEVLLLTHIKNLKGTKSNDINVIELKCVFLTFKIAVPIITKFPR